MSVSRVLDEGWELIADPRRWCQSAEARNSRGDAVIATSGDACAWCATGAVARAARHRAEPEAEDAAVNYLDDAAVALFPATFIAAADVNDVMGHAEVGWLYAVAVRWAQLEEAADRARAA